MFAEAENQLGSFLCPLFGQSVNRRTDLNNILQQKLNKLARPENNSREIGLHDLYRLLSYGHMHRDRSLHIGIVNVHCWVLHALDHGFNIS